MTTEQQQEFSARNWTSHPRPEIYAGRSGDSRSVDEIAPVFRHVFHEFTRFNEIQSMVMDDMLYTDKSLVVSAPTGSGKTAIFELAMVRLLMKLEDAKYTGDFRMVYIAPIKALCTEKFNDWRGKFDRLGVKCAEVTGDTEFRELWDLPDCNLILTTPEKWNSITRRWRQNVNFVRLIKLVMIDEVHILNDQFRGPILEAVVSRMRSIHRFVGANDDASVGASDEVPAQVVEPMRIIALSATAPNVADLAAWVGEGNTTCFYNISESRRPIKIDKHVLGFYCDPNTNPFRFDINLNYKLFDIISKHSGGRPTLVFCSTRKATETASNHLVEHHALKLSPEQQNALHGVAEQAQQGELKRRLMAGFAYHHAGLSYADRNLIEDSFRAGHIPVLCCTSALAMGVNLPAHLVVIKSTQMYTDYGMDEYPESSIFQMIGRAGRPQFDTFGVAVIMTQRENVQRYERLATGSVPIESFLHEHLAEHLNSEIVLQTITDLASAMDWIRSTFLYVRALAAPVRYGFPANADKPQLERNLEELCRSELNALEKYSLIVVAKDQGNPHGGMTFSSTLYGRLMALYCLSFRTVKLLRKIKGTEPLLEMFTLLTHCDEFSVFKCRNSAKRSLNDLNRSTTQATVRFPLRGRIQSTTSMTSCLIQAVFGNLTIEDHSLQQEASKMIAVGRRLAKCMAEFVYVGRNGSADAGEDGECGIYQALLSTLTLGQCLETKLWENSPFVAKQLRGIGAVYARQLAARGKISFQEIKDTDPRELEVILKKAPPFGNDLIEFVRKLPIFCIELVLKKDYMMEVTVTQQNKSYERKTSVKMSILVGDTNNQVLFFKDNCDANPGGSNHYKASFKITDATVASATGHVICANWVGLDCSTTIVVNEEAAVVASSTAAKQRTRKVAPTRTVSKKITEFYQKEDPKETMSKEIPKVNEVSEEPNLNQTVSSLPTITIDSSPKKRLLDSFRFTQKSKLSFNKENESDWKGHNDSDVEIAPKRQRVDLPNCDPVILEYFSGKPKSPEPISSTPVELAPCIPEPVSHNDTANRREYFTEMHRNNPFILFGPPELCEAQQERQRSSVRRVCLFGVFTEMPRSRCESGSTLASKTTAAAGVRCEREAFRTMYSADGGNGLFYRRNYYHTRGGGRELDLGIEEFLDSASESNTERKDFFR